MLSQKNVYSNIMESDYFVFLNDYAFVFTSYRKLLKFKNDLERNRMFQKQKMARYFILDIVNMDFIYDLMLYMSIEKNGFRVEYKGVEYECLSNLKLELVNKTEQG